MSKPIEPLPHGDQAVRFRTAYGPHDADRYDTPVGEKSMTEQSHKKECDINNIMARYLKTGVLDHVAIHQGNYGDVSDIGSFQESLQRVMDCQQTFDTLPAELRAQFQNDPGLFMDYVLDPENEEGMRELGLLPPSKPDGSGGAGGGSPEPAPTDPAAEPPAEPAATGESPPAS